MKLYGIPNCNTVKKARDWLAQHQLEVEFHDFKKHGLSAEVADSWLAQTEWARLINRSGLTWRGLPDERKNQITDNASAQRLMLEKHSVIKRPLLVNDDGILLHIGFDAAAYSTIFKV